MMTPDQLWQQGWLGVVVNVAAALIAAALLSMISKTARAKFWRPLRNRIGGWLRWLWSFRPAMTARQRAAFDLKLKRLELDSQRFKEVCDLLEVWPVRDDSTVVPERIAALRDAKETAWAHAREQIDATQSLAQQQLADQARRGAELAETARELGRTEGHAQALAEVEAQRAAPRLRPVWRVVSLGEGTYMLKNTQDGIRLTDVKHVSLEVPLGDFVFHGSNQWPGFFPGEMTFSGELVGNGRRFGANLVIRWHDVNGDKRYGEVLVPHEPRRGVIL
ncbi:hypothetical protein OYT00_01955 [Microbacterium paraoxydans]|uniref:hypothetical protein n=1 Tax=Microbacterium paraoxydans TaxID=199592 RepID=UPI0022861BF4|nr:hypothetical protein [Microbacterium paraoxydans]MCZ0708751.1 hypothetical protein [Microbacterium paraoxydans]